MCKGGNPKIVPSATPIRPNPWPHLSFFLYSRSQGTCVLSIQPPWLRWSPCRPSAGPGRRIRGPQPPGTLAPFHYPPPSCIPLSGLSSRKHKPPRHRRQRVERPPFVSPSCPGVHHRLAHGRSGKRRRSPPPVVPDPAWAHHQPLMWAHDQSLFFPLRSASVAAAPDRRWARAHCTLSPLAAPHAHWPALGHALALTPARMATVLELAMDVAPCAAAATLAMSMAMVCVYVMCVFCVSAR